MAKIKRQRATLTLVDEGDGFRATVQYQPSLKGREMQNNSPSINAMVRLCLIIARAKESIGAPLTLQNKRLTFRDRVRGFLHGIRQKRNSHSSAPMVETSPQGVEASILEEGAPQLEKGNQQ